MATNSWPVIFVDFFHQTHPEFSYQNLDDFVAIHKATPKQIKNPINPEAKAFILVCDPFVDNYIPESVFTDKKVVAVGLNVSKFTDKVFDFVAEVSKNAKKAKIPLLANIFDETMIESGKILKCIFENMDSSQVIIPLNGFLGKLDKTTMFNMMNCHFLISESNDKFLSTKKIEIPIHRLLIASPKNAIDPTKSANILDFYDSYNEIIDFLAEQYELTPENIIQGTTHFARKFLKKFDELCKDDFDALPMTAEEVSESEPETTMSQKQERPRKVDVEHVQPYVDGDYDSVTDTDDEFVNNYFYEKPNNQFYQDQIESANEKFQNNEVLDFLQEVFERQKEQIESLETLSSKPLRPSRKLTEKAAKTPSKKTENPSKNRVVDSEGCWQDAREKSSETVKAKEPAPKVTSSVKDRVVDSEGRWQDVQGRWHGPDGKYIKTPDYALNKTISSVQSTPKSTSGTTKSSATVNVKEAASKVTSLMKDRVVDSEGRWQDVQGRWRNSKGQYCPVPEYALSTTKTVGPPISPKPVSSSAQVQKPSSPSNRSSVSSSTKISVTSHHVTDSEGRYQDSNGRWHNRLGRFCETPDYAKPAPKPVQVYTPAPTVVQAPKPPSPPVSYSTSSSITSSANSNRVTDSQGRFQDSSGRWHGSNGRFCQTPDYAKPSVYTSPPSMSFMSTDLYGGGSLFNGGGGSYFGGGSSSSMSGYTIDRNGRYHDAATGRFCKRPW
uniref:Uncharacterized protein n=1 Tax=Panagrolaimus sp. JU765 TaxID=591449 RepID=A0AC34PXU5_9BILA